MKDLGLRFSELTDPRGLRLVHQAAALAITGYSAAGAIEHTHRRQTGLDRLFTGHGPAPAACTVLAAADRTGNELYGAVIIEAPYYAQIATSDPKRARSLAGLHRTLSAMFVCTEHRGAGLGTHLLREVASWHALRDGVRYIDGFVDDRNDSVDFYRQAGAVVMDRNTGLPPREPSNTALDHVAAVNGHWFYLDLWQLCAGPMLRCSRCDTVLAFEPADGGRLTCATCGPPP